MGRTCETWTYRSYLTNKLNKKKKEKKIKNFFIFSNTKKNNFKFVIKKIMTLANTSAHNIATILIKHRYKTTIEITKMMVLYRRDQTPLPNNIFAEFLESIELKIDAHNVGLYELLKTFLGDTIDTRELYDTICNSQQIVWSVIRDDLRNIHNIKKLHAFAANYVQIK